LDYGDAANSGLDHVPEDIVLVQNNSQQSCSLEEQQSQENELNLQSSRSDGHSSSSLDHCHQPASQHHSTNHDSAKYVQNHHEVTNVNSNDEKHKIQTFVREHLFPKVKFILCDEDLDYHGRQQSW
jgi:hypothetical protein